MKMKKAIASVAAAAMAASTLSAFAMSASAVAAGATSIDFEDGDCSFVYMNVDAGADNSVLSVEEFNGSKQLKVDVQDSNNVPKVWFDLDKICNRDTTIQINSIELDLTFVPKNAEEAVGWAGGAIGAAGGFDQADPAGTQINPSWSDGQWACEDENAYTPGMAATVHVTRKFLLPSTKYSAEGTNPFFGIMRWASEVDYVMYVDNVVLKDKSGAALALGVTAAAEETEAPAEETAAVEETTAAPAETEAPATEAAPVETEAPAPAVDLSTISGDIISDTEATSAGAWGQALTLTTVKNENGVFDPAMLTADKAVVVYYEADTAPEVVLQSWSGGEGWAKVPADEALSSDGVAVYTYDTMTAMYQADNFVDTLDAFIVGDTGSALKVTKVMLVDAASLTGDAASAPATEAAPAVTEAAPAPSAPVADAATPVAPTGNTAAAAFAAVMAVAGAAALISKRK